MTAPRWLAWALTSALVGTGESALAQGGLDELATSPDVSIAITSPALVVDDEDAVVEVGSAPALANLGTLPGPSDLTGYHLEAAGGQLFVLDTAATLSGGVTAEPRDVVRRSSSGVYSIALDGSAIGIPAGSHIDALTVAVGSGDIVFSLDTTATLGAINAADEDLVRWNGASFSLLFDGSAAGVAEAADLDAADLAGSSGDLLVSFDVSGNIDGVSFDDEDVLAYDPAAHAWTLYANLSARDTAWRASDLDALHVLSGLCGDANDDAFVGPKDGDRIRGLLANPAGAALTPAGASKCSVIGSDTDCNVADWAVLRRAYPLPGVGPGIAPVCAAAN